MTEKRFQLSRETQIKSRIEIFRETLNLDNFVNPVFVINRYNQ